jgi:hypothetical protein
VPAFAVHRLQVGVTCNFNDVTNTRVEVRPDRNYLKQQLKAVEARVTAIQEKKRKLDARMSVLTEGLKVGFGVCILFAVLNGMHHTASTQYCAKERGAVCAMILAALQAYAALAEQCLQQVAL